MKLMLYVQHGKNVYRWVQYVEEDPLHERNEKTWGSFPIHSRFFCHNNVDSLFYLSLTENREEQTIKMVKLTYMGTVTKEVYAEKAQNEKLKTFALDIERGKIIMLIKYH